MSACYVYEIVNNTNGKRYVGSTINPPEPRWREHRWKLNKGTHHSFKLQSAWKKHGKERFSFKTILICDKKDLVFYERELIKMASYNVAQDPLRNGIEARWVGHVKKQKAAPYTKERKSKDVKLQWKDPTIREKRIAGQKRAFANPEVIARFRDVKLGIKQPRSAVEKTARSKWRPVYCKELEVSFLNQKYAAEHLCIARSTVTEAIKRKGKVFGKYTLVRVA